MQVQNWPTDTSPDSQATSGSKTVKVAFVKKTGALWGVHCMQGEAKDLCADPSEIGKKSHLSL